MGSVSACGLLLDDGEIDTFLVNKITGMEEVFLEELAMGIPTLSMEKARVVSRFIQRQVEKILEH